MKKTLALAGIALFAFAPLARGNDDKTAANSTQPTDSAVKIDRTAWPATSAPAHKIKENGVPNFGKLNDDIWRSGQPTKDGYKRLAAQGLKTVVNLREEFPQDKDLLPAGVNYVYIPIKDQHEPTAAQAKQFMDVVTNPDNWPVLVHCQGGQGRAGTMAALVRHSMDGWDYDKTMTEVESFRSKVMGLFSVPMAGCQRTFIKNWENTPKLAVVASSLAGQQTASAAPQTGPATMKP